MTTEELILHSYRSLFCLGNPLFYHEVGTVKGTLKNTLMLSPFSSWHGTLSGSGAEGLQVWKVAANILSKKSQTANTG
jgi:hypothetical protein